MKIPKHLKFVKLKSKGRSLFASEAIKKGEVILQMKGHLSDDQHSSPEALQIDKDKFLDSQHYHVDDYINHSCRPNSYWDFENLQIRALKNIKQGEEITSNYNTAEYDLVNSATPSFFKCKCGSKNCVKEIKGFKYLTKKQKTQLKSLLSPFLKKKIN